MTANVAFNRMARATRAYELRARKPLDPTMIVARRRWPPAEHGGWGKESIRNCVCVSWVSRTRLSYRECSRGT